MTCSFGELWGVPQMCDVVLEFDCPVLHAVAVTCLCAYWYDIRHFFPEIGYHGVF